MHSSTRESYLVAQVTTATPQKLHLMLIDAALRHTRRSLDQWAAGQDEDASESLIRAQQIVTELLSSLNPEADRLLARKLAGIYMFIFRSLVRAHVERSIQAAEDALRILNEERETWRLVCEQTAADPPPVSPAATLEMAPPAAQPQPDPAPLAPGYGQGPAAPPPVTRTGWPGAPSGYGPAPSPPGHAGFSLNG